jgi:DNA-binding transcriptional LysR family regulator
MDWRAVKFDWNRARAFLVTAEEGSLSAAARALGMAQPTLGRQVAALEAELGLALFERGGRGLMPTPAGLGLLDHVREMGAAAARMALAASGQTDSIEGRVTITASDIYAAFLLPPIIAGLRQSAPGITLEIVATNAVSDLMRHEADIAIRNARPDQPDLVGRLTGEFTARLYAAPEYLARIGPIARPADLTRADFIGFPDTDLLRTGLNALGLSLQPENFPLIAADHVVHWQLACAGAGIGVFPAHLGDAEPRLARVLDALPPVSFPVWLVAHRDLVTNRRIRLVFDRLVKEITALRAQAV